MNKKRAKAIGVGLLIGIIARVIALIPASALLCGGGGRCFEGSAVADIVFTATAIFVAWKMWPRRVQDPPEP